MDIKVDISPEAINKAVADAIINSAIGEELDRVIKDQVSKLGRSYDNPIEAVVKNEIGDCIREVVRTQFIEQIRAMVAEKVTEKFTSAMFEKMWEAFVGRY